MASSKTAMGDFVQKAVLTTTMSASNTLTFEKLETGLSAFDKIGWVLQKLVWTVSPATLALFNGTGDSLEGHLTMSNSIAAANLSAANPSVYASKALSRLDFGTAANALLAPTDFVDDFSTMAGGGILILPNPIYLGVVSTGLTAAATLILLMYFKAVPLEEADYTNLVLSRQTLITT